jgi:hypothetical protein
LEYPSHTKYKYFTTVATIFTVLIDDRDKPKKHTDAGKNAISLSRPHKALLTGEPRHMHVGYPE